MKLPSFSVFDIDFFTTTQTTNEDHFKENNFQGKELKSDSFLKLQKVLPCKFDQAIPTVST